MQSRLLSSLFYSVLFSFMFFFSPLQSQVLGEEKEWIILQDNLSQESERFIIPLKFSESSSYFYRSSTQKFKSKKIEEIGDQEVKYTERLDFGTAIDGNDYSMLVRDASDLIFISENSRRLCQAQILCSSQKEKAATLLEGYLFLQQEVNVPLEVCSKQIAVPSKDPVPMTFRITVSANNPPEYEGSLRINIKGTVSGSTATDNASLSASITCKDSLDLSERSLNVSVKPYDDKMATFSVKGKISDILTVGSAKLAAEKIASDGSEIVFALLHGELVQEKAKAQGLRSTLEEDKPFPDFARVELVNRTLMTLDELKKEAGPEGHIVLVFGDFKRTMPGHFGGMPLMKRLTLDEEMICTILRKDNDKPLVVCFVCQELAISYLYEKWLEDDPDFYVFSDLSNPLDVQFKTAEMQQIYYGPPSVRGETLRGQLSLPEDKVVTALINGQGDLVWLNADAGKELSSSLVHINKLIKEAKTSQKQDSLPVDSEIAGE